MDKREQRHTRRGFLKGAGLGAAALAAPGCSGISESVLSAFTTRKPNFIVIFTDDQGYQDLGCYGAPLIKTPNLDQMAAEGMKFTDFYSACSVCSPSRAALLTGCYPPRVGITQVLFPKNKIGLNPSEITIADLLKAQGYATACVGKWHLGHLPDFLPTRQGFDSYFGIPYSNDMRIERDGKKGPPVMEDEKIVEHPAQQETLTKRYTERAIEFITANRDRPFFLYLPHTMPHIPLYVTKEFEGKSRGGLYGDTIEEIDSGVGEILGTLKKLGIDDNTLVVYTSDNGPWLGLNTKKNPRSMGGSALPLRAGKFSTYEGGMRVPCLAHWPRQVPAGKVCGEVAGTIDLLPTIARLAGAPLPEDRVIDGKDVWPLMSGRLGARSPHEAYYYYRGKSLNAVREGKWKLFRKNKKKGPELYDLETDVRERINMADQHPDVVKRLATRMDRFDAELKANSRPPGKVKDAAGEAKA